ncbi:MAG: hypothetical protein BWX86_01972 [Verrucomicrobia bacterium ADurb.Bin122]|nr:MAG: hypothetical protein BWX86_01972 [Verrucomicrobia bacterium ADurb.Bin122]
MQRLGARVGLVVAGGVVAHLVERRVDRLNRVRAPGDLDDGRAVEGLAEGLRVDRRGGDDDFQLGPHEAQVAQMAEQEVDVERAFVGLVEDDGVVAAQLRVALHLGEQHAVGEKLDARVGGGLVAETDLAADLAAPLDAELLGHASRDRERGHAARLRAGDASALAAARRETHFRNLRGFAGARLAGQDHHLVLLDRGHDLLGPAADRQLGREIQTEAKRVWRGRHATMRPIARPRIQMDFSGRFRIDLAP